MLLVLNLLCDTWLLAIGIVSSDYIRTVYCYWKDPEKWKKCVFHSQILTMCHVMRNVIFATGPPPEGARVVRDSTRKRRPPGRLSGIAIFSIWKLFCHLTHLCHLTRFCHLTNLCHLNHFAIWLIFAIWIIFAIWLMFANFWLIFAIFWIIFFLLYLFQAEAKGG